MTITSRHALHSSASLAEIGRATRYQLAERRVVRLGVTTRVQSTASSRAERRSVLRTDQADTATAVSLELIPQQLVIVVGQRGVIMRGRKRARLWPPARGSDVSRPDVHRSPVDADANTDDALLALVRLLARQAAREVFAQTVAELDDSVEEGRE